MSESVWRAPMMQRERRIESDGTVVVGSILNERGQLPFGYLPRDVHATTAAPKRLIREPPT